MSEHEHVFGRFGEDDPDGWSCGVCGVTKDQLDGAALRRLIEALKEGWDWEVGTGFALDSPDIPHDHVVVRVSLPGGLLSTPRPLPAAHWDAGWEVIGSGKTLAEAADKCREALEGKG